MATNIDNTAHLFQYTDPLDPHGSLCPPAQPDCLGGPDLPLQPGWMTSNTRSVTRLPDPTPSIVTFYQYAPTVPGFSYPPGQVQTIPFDGGQYDNSGSGTFASLAAPYVWDTGVNGFNTPLDLNSPVDVRETRAFHAGEPIFITLEDHNRNTDPAVREIIVLTVRSSTGDVETLRLQETGPNTGIFSAAIQSAGPSQPVTSFNGQLSVAIGSTITVDYQDAYYPIDTASNQALVDPFGIVFDTVTGQPVNGIVVTMIDRDTGLPAQVFGDDGVSAFPATLTTGGTATDSSGAVYTNPPGGFRYPFVRPGNYRFDLVTPNNYLAPSMVPAGSMPTGPGGAPYAVVQGSYNDPFVVLPGPALNIDIPIDPLSTNLLLQKAVTQSEASVGDFLQYRLTLTNRDPVLPALGANVVDVLPIGMVYQSGSLRMNGAVVADPVIAADGRTMTIPVGNLVAGASMQITYVVVVGAGVPIGDAINNAQANANSATLLSNPAQVAVRVRETLMIGRFTIIGRVFEGDCNTPWQDLRGVPNVRVMMEDGTYVLTDSDGQYHFEGVRPGTHVVQMDLDSLPGSLQPQSCIENTRFAGNNYSQFVDVKGGGLWRADFHTRKRIDNVGLRLQSSLEVEESVYTPPRKKKVRPVTFAPRQVKDYTLRAEFDSCRATLKPEGLADVENLIADLREENIEKIELVGNTDNQRLSVRCLKIYKDNYALSDDRAKTVGDALAAALGLKPEQITTVGRGPDNPVADNKTPEGMARNRRTELKVFLAAQEVAAPTTIEDEYEDEEPQSVKTITLKGMTHRIEVDGSVPVKDLRVMAMLPEGYAYSPVSTRIDDLAGGGPSIADGLLTFRLGDVESEKWSHVIEFGVEAIKQDAPKPKVVDKQTTLHANFDSCSTTLKREGELAVAKLIKDLRDITIERLELVGHTDDQRLSPRCQKTYPDNYALSQARARAIGDVVAQALSLKPSQVIARGMGPDAPVASNKSPEGMAANRRTEVYVQGTVLEAASTEELRPACETKPYVIKSMASFESLLKKRVQTPMSENSLACGADATAQLQAAAAAAAAVPVKAPVADAPAADAAAGKPADAAVEAAPAAMTPDAAAAEPEASKASAAATDSVAAAAEVAAEPAPVVATPVDPARADSGRKDVAVEGGLVKFLPLELRARTKPRESILADADAAGAKTDWLDGQKPGNAWLFPPKGHNPRSPAVRIVIKHGLGDVVSLRTAAGDPVSALNYDGTVKSADERVVASIWRGVPLQEGNNDFVAEITDAKTGEVTKLEGTVVYANTPVRAELVPEQSVLLADGANKPVIAIRLLDRDGHPVRAGVTGPIQISLPYVSAQEAEQQKNRQLAGLDRFQPQYRVEGDEGIAYVELAPTTDSGAVTVELNFQSGLDMTRTQQLRTWVEPAPRDWVVVGFAEGTVGYNTLKKNIQPMLDEGVEDGGYTNGQVSLYAKGRVKGEWLLTMAFDSDKDDQGDRRRSLLSQIDPNQFYTLYGDGTEQRHDASSQDNLYLKLERGQFYALFGDYETGLSQTELSRYSRTLNGLKVEKGDGRVTFIMYAANTPQMNERREIQGNGTSGLYRLNNAASIVLNSERIRIETRDRIHSERIVETRMLARHLDYNIDYSGGTVYFREPIPSRDTDFNPVFIVAEYETFTAATTDFNVGGRVAVLADDEGKVQVGLTALRDDNALGATRLTGLDAKVQVAADTAVRAEIADSNGQQGLVASEGSAWLVELEHHNGKYDGLLYTRRQEAGFGVNQQNAGQTGQTKTGADGRMRLDNNWSVEGQLYSQQNLATDDTRDAVQGKLRYDSERGGYSLGAQVVNDDAAAGPLSTQSIRSEQATFAANRWMMDRKLELSTQVDTAFGGNSDSVDFPDRLMLGANYALTDHTRLLAGQEFTEGGLFNTSTTRLGLQTLPWKGARLDTTLNQSQMSEAGPRTFAQYGLTQAVLVNERWGLDFSLDASNTFNESAQQPLVLNPAQPVAPGGTLNSTGVTEDYYALSAGATYRADIWSWNGRAETRVGDTSDKYGFVSHFLRQAKAGVAFGTAAEIFKTQSMTGTDGLMASLDLSWAWRPLGERWSLLDRLEFRYDTVENGTGLPGGGVFSNTSLNTVGNATTRRIINNLAINRVSREWTGEDRKGNLFNRYERNQWSFYYGAKYAMDTFDGEKYSGYTDLIGAEVRHDITSKIDIGVQASSLNSWDSHTHKYSVGPMIGFSPVKNGWITVGYNYRGFYDRDFDAARYTGEGFYLQLRLKFDQNTRIGRSNEDNMTVDPNAGSAVQAATR